MPTVEPLNTIPIQQFINQVKSAKNSKSQEVKIGIQQAENLVFTLGLVMSRLEGDLEKIVAELKNSNDQTIDIQIGANSDWK